MSAERSARSVSHAMGVDRVRALQRVLYRCAKQDQDRRFHALFDKVARSDVPELCRYHPYSFKKSTVCCAITPNGMMMISSPSIVLSGSIKGA